MTPLAVTPLFSGTALIMDEYGYALDCRQFALCVEKAVSIPNVYLVGDVIARGTVDVVGRDDHSLGPMAQQIASDLPEG